MVTLRKALRQDCDALHRIQVACFRSLLDKYRDYATNPGAESVDRIVARYLQKETDDYLVLAEDTCVGMMRVCNFGDICRVSPICILPEHRGNGYARKAMLLAQERYPHARKWTLDTIAQESKLCRLYEGLGYRQTGKRETIQDGMDLVFYEKIL